MQIIPAVTLGADGIQPAAPRQEGFYRNQGGSGRLFESIMAANAFGKEAIMLEDAAEGENLPGLPTVKKVGSKTEIDYSAIFSGLVFQQGLAEDAAASSDEQTLEECRQIIDSIVTILEGNAPYTDMDNLLQKLDSLLGGLYVPLEQNASKLAQEITARMPQINAIKKGDAPTSAQQLANAESGSPCPLENENEISAALLGEKATETTVTHGQWPARAREAAPQDANGPQALAEAPPAAEVRAQHSEMESGPGEHTEKDQTDQRTELAAQADTSAAARSIDIAPLRAEAGIALENAAAPQATRETLLDTMVEQMTLTTENGTSTVEIELKPDFLGKVSIELSLDQHGLQAKIRAEDPGIRNLIGGQVNQLIETLSQKGIRVSGLEVVYTGLQAQNFEHGRSDSGQQKENGRQSGERVIDKIRQPMFETPGIEMPPMQTKGIPDSATVEYLA